MPDVTYVEAVNCALARALEEDDRVLVFGEDVGLPGGVFGATKGLQRRFGAKRVFDTPISEAAILGAAVGAAQLGARPIVEIMWADFTLVALDQLVNQASNVRYISRGEVSAPLVVRMQQGSAPGSCAQHSQSLEALFLHIPGLRVAMPSSAQDAYDCLITACATGDPTIVIENRSLYFGRRSLITETKPSRDAGWSNTLRHGDAGTVVVWGAITLAALDACDQLSAEGSELTVIETPWLNPIDIGGIIASVEATGRVAVVHEANVTGGFGAEIVSRVCESGVALKAPPIRVGTLDMRIPAAPALAAAVIPSRSTIETALRALIAPR